MHDLDFDKYGNALFAYQQKNVKAIWHRHGTQVEDGATFEDMIAQVPVLATIADAPIYAEIDGQMVLVEDQKLIYRSGDGRQLSVMGQGYEYLQPAEAFGFLADVTGSGDITVETLGALRDGKQFFFSAKVNSDPLEILPGEFMDSHIMGFDSYDGSTVFQIVQSNVLAVCANTVAAALWGSTRKATSKHTKSIRSADRLERMRQALGIVSDVNDSFAAFAQALAKVSMDANTGLEFFQTLIGASENQEDWTGQQARSLTELTWLKDNGRGQSLEGRKDTAWGAFNAVTEWTNHVKRYKSSVDTDRTGYVLQGSGAAINNKAQQILVHQYQIAA